MILYDRVTFRCSLWTRTGHRSFKEKCTEFWERGAVHHLERLLLNLLPLNVHFVCTLLQAVDASIACLSCLVHGATMTILCAKAHHIWHAHCPPQVGACDIAIFEELQSWFRFFWCTSRICCSEKLPRHAFKLSIVWMFGSSADGKDRLDEKPLRVRSVSSFVFSFG